MYQSFVQSLPMLAQMPPPFAMIAVKTNPALTLQQKREIIDALEKLAAPNPEQQAMQQAEMQSQQERTAAEVEGLRAKAFKDMAQGEAAAARAYAPQVIPQGQPIAA